MCVIRAASTPTAARAPHTAAMARGASPKRAPARDDGATTKHHYPPSVMDARATRAADADDDDAGDEGARARAAAAATPPLGARAKALRDASDGEASGDQKRPLDGALRDARRGDRGTERGTKARADSLAALLSQALRADDAALIERCLSVSDRTTIANTVAKLSSTHAMKLLSECAARAQAKPNSGERCAKWARTILLHHAGYASSAPKARTTLMRLSQTIESHVAMQGPLQALLGRLELVLHASAMTKGGADDVDELADAEETLTTVYDEATDAVDILQDVMGRERAGASQDVEDEEGDEDDESEEEDESEDESEDDEEDEEDESEEEGDGMV